MTAESICVLGLGLMGRPLARELVSSGHDVRGWNRSQLAPELVSGITVVPDLEQAAAAETLVLMLLDSGAVGEVLAGLEPHLRAGQLLVDMGTSRPADSVERAARLAERGIGWVDAPVSGGPPAIVERRLAIYGRRQRRRRAACRKAALAARACGPRRGPGRRPCGQARQPGGRPAHDRGRRGGAGARGTLRARPRGRAGRVCGAALPIRASSRCTRAA